MKRIHVALRCLVLAAMMLSFAESVWASMCAGMSVVTAGAPMGEMSGMPDMPDMPGMPGEGEQHGSEPWCPLGPAAAAQGCVTAVPLPASSAQPFMALPERQGDGLLADAPSDLLHTTKLFHPPRI